MKGGVMTEDQAKTKWCPHVRFADPIDGGKPSVEPTTWNRFDGEWDYTGLLCIASDCMMWRREKDTYGDDYGKGIPEDRGFCGLAGKV
jgi:hypothetical protein